MKVVDGLEFMSIDYICGMAPKSFKYKNAITDPPNMGRGLAFIMRGEKRSTIFCPYSFNSYQVHNECFEMNSLKEPRGDFNMDFWRKFFPRKWAQHQKFGYMRDYNMCARVLKMLGIPVPANTMIGGGEDTRKRGGKTVAPKLLRVVNHKSKRGKFLAWFLESEGYTRSIREAMAEFEITRSNTLSYLHMLNKDHGLGYEIIGDLAVVELPVGCTDPFTESESNTENPDDSWLDGDNDDSWLD